MTKEEFYGTALPYLRQAEELICHLVSEYERENEQTEHGKRIEYYKSRIKSPESMIQKLQAKQLPVTLDSALYQVHDALGVRIICSFIDDIYDVANWLQTRPFFEVVQIKDYIAYPKPNGYRSYHMILQFQTSYDTSYFAEIQIRTIALDFWASLEHQLKYKQDIKNEHTIRSELKRCSDEIASIDLSMQTIKDLILQAD